MTTIENHGETLAHGLAFVLGFSAVFVVLGAAASAVGAIPYDEYGLIAKIGRAVALLAILARLDAFEMYHRLDLRASLEQAGTFIGITELLLTRLQYLEMTFGILRELCALFLEHSISTDREEGRFDASQIARLCGEDWGWYKTVTMNLDRVSEFAPALLKANDQMIVVDRIEQLKTRIEGAPKSLRWQTRARVGDTTKWYETPVVVSRQ